MDTLDDSSPWLDTVGRCKISSRYSDVQFKTYKLLFSGIFHLAFLEPGRWWVTEPEESETVEKGDHCI